MRKAASLAGRVLLSSIFIVFGFNNIMNFSAMQQIMAEAGIPMNGLLLILGTIFELAGGLSLLLGYKARLGAGALIAFITLATLFFHMNLSDQMQFTQFMKNLSILGGLLMVVVLGPGPLSFDMRSSRHQDR